MEACRRLKTFIESNSDLNTTWMFVQHPAAACFFQRPTVNVQKVTFNHSQILPKRRWGLCSHGHTATPAHQQNVPTSVKTLEDFCFWILIHICAPDVAYGTPASPLIRILYIRICVCLKSLDATLWFLNTFQHLSDSRGFFLMSHIILTLVNSCAVISNGVICIFTLMHSFGVQHLGAAPEQQVVCC